MTMEKLISEKAGAAPLGATPEGRAWCMKALNPASPVGVVGMPDYSLGARVVKHYERTFTMSFAAAAANWSGDILMHPNVWTPAAISVADGATTTPVQIFNSQIGLSSDLVREFIHDNVEAYRVIYGSLTAVLDATSLTNSGMVAASQYILRHKSMSYDSGVAGSYCNVPIHCWPDTPRPYDSLVQTPGAYLGEAKDGVYIVLRIDEPRWIYSNDVALHQNTLDTTAMGLNDYNATRGVIGGGPSTAGWPFGIASYIIGTGRYDILSSQDTVAHISFQNLNAAANVRVTYRLGVEFKVVPQTPFSSDMVVPPMYDPMALDMYKAVSAKMALAYPASYNDWQKILGVIAKVAKVVAPMLPLGGLVEPIIDPLHELAIGAGKAIVARRAARKAKNAATNGKKKK